MKNKIFLFLVVFLGFILRFYQLGINPVSLDWDEASLGYNAYSILKTGKDEYGNFMPLTIKSFGDYKPPLYVYLCIIPVWIFGLNEYSTRFVSAFFGVLAVFVSYFLVKKLLPHKLRSFYLLSSFLFAVSPWHIQFSRTAFEANVALTLFLSGFLFFLKGRNRGYNFILSALIFSLTFYTYHSTRLVVPLFFLGAVIIYYKAVIRNFRWAFAGCIVFILFIFPIIVSSSTSARFGSVTIINPFERLGSSIKKIEYDTRKGDFLGVLSHNRRLVYLKNILGGYLDHFSFDFLFLNGDLTGRHHATGMGMLYFIEFPFVLIGTYYFLAYKNKGSLLLFWWFITAPAASALTKATPHAVRSLLYLPIYQIFIAAGLIHVLKIARMKIQVSGNSILKKAGLLKKLFPIGIAILFFPISIFYYLHQYYVHTPVDHAQEWQYGYKEIVKYAGKFTTTKNKIIVTNEYDQPYIFFLFYNKTDPLWYQSQLKDGEINRNNRSFGIYDFRKIEWEKDVRRINVLIIGSPKEIPEGASGLEKEILFPDGTVAFRIAGR